MSSTRIDINETKVSVVITLPDVLRTLDVGLPSGRVDTLCVATCMGYSRRERQVAAADSRTGRHRDTRWRPAYYGRLNSLDVPTLPA
jgi:hypothetical protein